MEFTALLASDGIAPTFAIFWEGAITLEEGVENFVSPDARKEDVQELKAAGDIASVTAFVSDIPEPEYEAALTEPRSAITLTDTRSRRARVWTRLESITVRNFKATLEAVIPLGQVTILVGPNGSGKSSVLQAVHWAARAASYIAPKNTKEMISFERLDYVPSSEPLRTAHKSELKTDTTSTPVEVVFSHIPIGEEKAQASIKIRAARSGWWASGREFCRSGPARRDRPASALPKTADLKTR